MEEVLTVAKNKVLLTERYKNGVKWLNANWDKPNYEKGLRRLEEIEDSLRALGATESDLNQWTRQASNEFVTQVAEEANKLLFEEEL